MTIGQISLTASARANLTALQGTAKLLGQTQSHLSTGKKVQSALDNAASFFASQGFLNSANDLDNLKNSMATALQTIKAASDAITSISNIVQQLQGVANSASQSQDATARTGYATQYNGLMSQLDQLANDATFNGTNLVNSVVSQLKVVFDATNTTFLTVTGSNLKTSGMGIGAAQHGFAANTFATSTTYVGTVNSTNAGNTGAYNAALDLTSNITGATQAGGANSGAGAIITSTAADFGAPMSDGATVTVASNTAGGLLTNGNAAFLLTQIGAIGLTLTTGTALDTGTAISATTILGQFTANGASSSTYASASNTLTDAGANNATLVIAAGQSIQVNATQASTAYNNVYTNQTTSAVTITLSHVGAADTVTVGANGTSNSTAYYKLSAGTITYTGLELTNGNTIGGSAIVDAGGASVGTAITAYSTTNAGTAAGTTTTAGVNAYDMSNATLSAITITTVFGSKNGVASTTYAMASGSSLTYAGATQMTGTSTAVVADSILTAQNQLTAALTTLRTAGSSLGNNNTLVQTRQDFTNSMIGDLQTASDNLILADTNEEGANMQALQAQNQLGIVSLGISGQLAQSILKLF
jgi:flagellin